MKNPKKTKNIIVLIIQLIYLVFRLINTICGMKGDDFLEDIEELFKGIENDKDKECTQGNEDSSND